MMAMLWAQQIMLGKKTYDQVPRLLKDEFIMEGMDGAKVKVRAYGENDTFGVWSEKKEVSGVDSTGGVEVHTVDIPYQGKTERSYFYAQN